MSKRKLHPSSNTLRRKERQARHKRRRMFVLGISAAMLVLALVGVVIWQNNSLKAVAAAQAETPAQVAPAAATSHPLELTVEEAFERYQDGALLLDVRTQQEWDASHVPGSVHIPLQELPSRLDELSRNEEIVVICRAGNRSQEGRDILRRAGFEKVSHVRGGVVEWFRNNYPFEGGAPIPRP